MNTESFKMVVLVTGVAGFIGFHVAKRLLVEGCTVVGIDSLDAYYDVALKKNRLEILKDFKYFSFSMIDISDDLVFKGAVAACRPDAVIHLAGQAGVRYSIDNPKAYGKSNLMGFLSVLEGCRDSHVRHLIFASSSSVYGGSLELPFTEANDVGHPVSLYAATKRANELMAYSYSHLYGIPTTGLRFFTVYGPWGRPDMAYFLFTKAILSGHPIDIYNNGKMFRDFTYIDDIVEAIYRVLHKIPAPSATSVAARIFNIGNGQPVELMDLVMYLEEFLGVSAVKNFLPMQMGDVVATHADFTALSDWINFSPSTDFRYGVGEFVRWYKDYYES